MQTSHDSLSTSIHEEITSKISHREGNWSQIFSTSLTRVGSWDWPRPDYAISDDTNNWLIASEFKPPGWDKREYITGLGQCISYLERHHYSMLVVPSISNDGFHIGEYIGRVLNLQDLSGLPICLVVYDPVKVYSDVAESLSIEKTIDSKRGTKPTSKATTNRTYWAFWRDISNFEILDMLKLSDRFSNQKGDIYSNHIFPKFFEMRVKGETRTWEGESRTVSGTSKMSEKQNNKIPLFHLGLWDQAEGRLTLPGYKLLNIGRRYGADSRQFMDYLAQLLLVEGKHLDLINYVQKFQDENDEKLSRIKKSVSFKMEVDSYLESKKLVGKRKPGSVTTGAKQTFLRDEPKVWNKLGLLAMKTSGQYFFPGRGFKFHWKRITDILTEDFSRF